MTEPSQFIDPNRFYVLTTALGKVGPFPSQLDAEAWIVANHDVSSGATVEEITQ